MCVSLQTLHHGWRPTRAVRGLLGSGAHGCERLPLRTLRSRKSLFVDGIFTSEPRGSGPAAVEAERRLHSWGSQFDLEQEMETGESLSPSTASRSSSAPGKLAVERRQLPPAERARRSTNLPSRRRSWRASMSRPNPCSMRSCWRC